MNLFDGIFDGMNIQAAFKTPLKAATSGADMNPSLPPKFINKTNS